MEWIWGLVGALVVLWVGWLVVRPRHDLEGFERGYRAGASDAAMDYEAGLSEGFEAGHLEGIQEHEAVSRRLFPPPNPMRVQQLRETLVLSSATPLEALNVVTTALEERCRLAGCPARFPGSYALHDERGRRWVAVHNPKGKPGGHVSVSERLSDGGEPEAPEYAARRIVAELVVFIDAEHGLGVGAGAPWLGSAWLPVVAHVRANLAPDIPDWNESERTPEADEEEGTVQPVDLWAGFAADQHLAQEINARGMGERGGTPDSWHAPTPEQAAIEADARTVAISGGAPWVDLAETALAYPGYRAMLADLARAVRADGEVFERNEIPKMAGAFGIPGYGALLADVGASIASQEAGLNPRAPRVMGQAPAQGVPYPAYSSVC